MADTNPKSEFIKKVNAHKIAKVDSLVLETLKDMLVDDLCVMDIFYITQKAREIVSQAYEKIDFASKEVSEARRVFLRKLITDVKRKMPKERKIEVKDATSERDARCERSAHAIAERIIDDTVLLSDDYYLITALNEDNRLLLQLLVGGYMDALQNGAEMSINQSLAKGNKLLWNGERDEIRMKNLDLLLKKK